MSKKSNDLLELIKETGIPIRKIATDLNIPEQRIYGWVNKGARPKYEDEQLVRAYLEARTAKSEGPKVSANDALLSVVASKVAELLSDKTGRSSLVELEQMKKDALTLGKMLS